MILRRPVIEFKQITMYLERDKTSCDHIGRRRVEKGWLFAVAVAAAAAAAAIGAVKTNKKKHRNVVLSAK